MTYKLAEQLYKAGFPNIKCSEESPNPGYSYPTLSELIEACLEVKDESDGRYSFSLEREIVLDNDGIFLEEKWTATRDSTFAQSKTKDEAVAKLWLKLNEKTD